MKFISLFSGIGGFEQGIYSHYPNANCIAFSEIDKYAIQIYEHHFPSHKNLGDITKITKEAIKELLDANDGCDLIVGGFPCTNLSSMANIHGNNKGLQGPKSGLFYDMVRVISYVKEISPDVKFIIENNYSMRKSQKIIITNTLKENFGDIYHHVINNAIFGVQTRKRILWTNFNFEPPLDNQKCQQTWEDVLEPLKNVQSFILSDKMVTCLNKLSEYKNTKGYTKIAVPCGDRYVFENVCTETEKSRWDIHSRSDNMDTQKYSYPVGKSRPITTRYSGGNNALIDRRFFSQRKLKNSFIFRSFTVIELERLFGLPDNYTKVEKISNTQRVKTIGNSIPVFISSYIIDYLKNKNS